MALGCSSRQRTTPITDPSTVPRMVCGLVKPQSAFSLSFRGLPLLPGAEDGKMASLPAPTTTGESTGFVPMRPLGQTGGRPAASGLLSGTRRLLTS